MISFQNIGKQYEGHRALCDVSFDIQKGKIFGLLGPNGAGKTTLLRLLTRMLLPDHGTVLFEGTSIQDHHLARIGYLPEERGLYPKMRADEHIHFLSSLKGIKKRVSEERLSRWAEKMEITDLLSRRIENLSKGQQQKIQLIASLVHEPDLLILDEPFSGFDPVNAEVIKAILQELKISGKTILISTHRMDSAEELCDEIAMLHKGRVVLNGNLSEILQATNGQKFKVIATGKLVSNELFEVLSGENQTFIVSSYEPVSTNKLLTSLMQQAEILYFSSEKKTLKEVFLERALVG